MATSTIYIIPGVNSEGEIYNKRVSAETYAQYKNENWGLVYDSSTAREKYLEKNGTEATASNPNGVTPASNTGLVYQGANGNTYGAPTLGTAAITGKNNQVYNYTTKTFSDPFGRTQIEYYTPEGNLAHQVSGMSPEEASAFGDAWINERQTRANSGIWNAINYRSTENYSPIQALSPEQTQQQQTAGAPEATAAQAAQQMQSEQLGWLTSENQLNRDANASTVDKQIAASQQSLDSYLEALNQQQSANIAATQQENQLNRDWTAEQSQLAYDRTSQLNQQNQDFGAAQAEADRNLQLTMQQTGLDAARQSQLDAFTQNSALMDKANAQDKELFGMTTQANKDMLQMSGDQQRALQSDLLAGQLTALDRQGTINQNLLAQTQEGDLRRQQDQNAAQERLTASNQEFMSRIEGERAANRLGEIQLTGDIARAQQADNNNFLRSSQQDQMAFQKDLELTRNESAERLLTLNLGAQKEAAIFANEAALQQLNAALAGQRAAQSDQFNFSREMSDTSFNRSQQQRAEERQWALDDRAYLYEKENQIFERNKQAAKEERLEQNQMRNENIVAARGRAFDAYAIGRTTGAGSSGSRAIQRYDGRGSVA